MTFFWISLKSCTHAHTKHNIGPRCTKVKKGSNHGAIYLLIHGLTIFIEIEMPIGWHGSFDGLGIFHVKLLEHILDVLGLTNESAILELLDLKSEEEGQLTHHRHLKSLCHNLSVPCNWGTHSYCAKTRVVIRNYALRS